jgi:formate hydrogenlyase subunit 3/multisubunit Na+/H+ antiporter MnhD subunit
VLPGLAFLLVSALLALAAGRAPRLSGGISALGCALGGGLLLRVAVPVLLGAAPVEVHLPLRLPGGAFSLGVDPLSALFLALVSALAIPASIFGAGYLQAHARRSSGMAFALFPAVVAAIAVVVTAKNALLFLMAWEAMTLGSFFLVAYDHEKPEVRRAAFTYLVASQLGGACILAAFAILAAGANSLDFAALAKAATESGPAERAVVFALALVGFGTKAGLVPLHVWLPLAHPAAPSHVSALMSGALIKTGFYGILRVLTFLGVVPAGFGLALLIAGAITLPFGILFSIGQRDLKRALAYSSIENMGVAAVGTGLMLLGRTLGDTAVAMAAACGTLLHLLNHMLMKGLLFLSAGSVLHATNARDVEGLGGLLHRMRFTGTAFLTGSAAISSLPPLCGFLGEWLIVSAAFRAAGTFPVREKVVVLIATLALILGAGLAAASFCRLFATVFLGQPRSRHASDARESGAALVLPTVAMACACVLLGLFPSAAIALVRNASAVAAGIPAPLDAALAAPAAAVSRIGAIAALLIAIIVAGAAARRLLGGARAAEVDTWGCGYPAPGPRLQYTASSFGEPLTRNFDVVLRARREERRPEGLFPAAVYRATEVPDRAEVGLYVPLFARLARRMAAVRRFQHGELSKYLLQIAAALVIMLIWAIVA